MTPRLNLHKLPVTSNGVYDIDIDDYHSQRCCPGPSISSGGLRMIHNTCPALFYAFSDLNPKRVVRDSAPLSFGRAAHALVLGEPEFYSKFVLSPFDEFKTKEAKAWRDEQKLQIVKQKDFDTIINMAAAQKADKQVMNAFSEGEPEKSLLWKDEDTGIWLKTRPDWLPKFPAVRYTTEYKTAVSINPPILSRAVFKYGYEMQAALCLDGIEIVMERKPLGMAHVCQEKTPPYLVDLRLFSDEQIDWGRRLYRRALMTFADCLEHDAWPGYTQNPQFFETPYTVQKQMEYDDDDGHESPFGGPDHDAFSAADYLGTG